MFNVLSSGFKRKLNYFTGLFFLVSSPVFSEPIKDSLVYFQDLNFINDAEKQAFLKAGNHPSTEDCIDLLLAPYGNRSVDAAKAHQQINECVSYLQKQLEGKTEVKKIKYIYEYVHKSFFKVYELNNSFSDIFTSGKYNCVSASAMYAIVFSKLNIPYQIKETPAHVYLIAYPETFKVMIETTMPEKGYFQFNDNYISKYVKSLYNSKTISREEYEKNPAADLFNKYYFSSANISLAELSGLQYSNFSIYDLEEKQYESAINEIKKAYYLAPCEKTRYVLKSALVYQITNNDYTNLKQVQHLALLCRYNNLKDKEVSNENIEHEFARVIDAQLIKNSEYNLFDQSWQLISKSVQDSALQQELSFTYHYELARISYLNSNNDAKQLEHLTEAYKISPKHASLQSMILYNFLKKVEATHDPVASLKVVSSYSNIFTFLEDHVQYNSVKSNCILEISYQQFSLGDLQKGEAYLKEFEELQVLHKSTESITYYVEKAYSVAAGIYYKKGNTAKARQLLKTGLIYAPESFGLRQRLSQL